MEDVKRVLNNIFTWYSSHAHLPIIFHTGVVWWNFLFFLSAATIPLMLINETNGFGVVLIIGVIYMPLFYASTHLVIHSGFKYYSTQDSHAVQIVNDGREGGGDDDHHHIDNI
jgi:hypothetical protein